jgi:hypothetical protein
MTCKHLWINVDDKLPEDERMVLVFSKESKPDRFISWYSSMCKSWMIKKNQFKEITHWQDLPEVPGDAE